MNQELKDKIRELANSKEAREMMEKAASSFMPENMAGKNDDG